MSCAMASTVPASQDPGCLMVLKISLAPLVRTHNSRSETSSSSAMLGVSWGDPGPSRSGGKKKAVGRRWRYLVKQYHNCRRVLKKEINDMSFVVIVKKMVETKLDAWRGEVWSAVLQI